MRLTHVILTVTSLFALFFFQQVIASSAGPEGIKWQLSALDGYSLPARTDLEEAFIQFDPEQQRASGYTGCNRFFASYTLTNSSLNFGPAGTTRKFCEGQKNDIETLFLNTLKQVQDWSIENGQLLFKDDKQILAKFSMVLEADVSTPDIKLLIFQSKALGGEVVMLEAGEYRTSVAPNAASEIRIKLSDMIVSSDAKNDRAVAIVSVSTGGTGSFHELALIQQDGNEWRSVDTVLLGDRIKVEVLKMIDKRIHLDVIIHSKEDPLCCPTQTDTRIFSIKEDLLVPVPPAFIQKKNELLNTSWLWQETIYNNDKRTLPDNSNSYSISFLEEGRFSAKADCNQKGGNYSAQASRLEINLIMSTMASCEPDSLEEEFDRNLAAASIYFFRDDELYIDLKADTGTMRFLKK